MFEPHDHALALFRAIASLALKLTGETFKVRIEDKDGNFVWFDSKYESDLEDYVHWSKEEGGVLVDDPLARDPMHSLRQDERHDTPELHPEFAQELAKSCNQC